MSVVALIRPDSWNFPLFLHVLGAMILVGGLLAGTATLGYARGEARFLKLGYWTLLAVSLPGWVLMRIGAAGSPQRRAGTTCRTSSCPLGSPSDSSSPTSAG